MSYKPRVKISKAPSPIFVVEYLRNNQLVYHTNCGSLVEAVIVAFEKAREFDPVTNPDTINSALYAQMTYTFDDHTVRVSRLS